LAHPDCRLSERLGFQRKSALLPEADISSACGHVGFVPEGDIGSFGQACFPETLNE
jgi:hypothetical protein